MSIRDEIFGKLQALPTSKQIKSSLLDLIDSGDVTAIAADQGGIKYYSTVDMNPALLSQALTSEQIKQIRANRNKGEKLS